jgi:hypothetical protein
VTAGRDGPEGGDDGSGDADGEPPASDRRRLAVGGFVVATLVGLALEVTVLGGGGLPFGVRSLFIGAGAAGGMWLVGGELTRA